MKPNNRLLEEMFRAARQSPSFDGSAGLDPGFAHRVARLWAERAPSADLIDLWEDMLRHVTRRMAILLLIAGLTAWASWMPVPTEPDVLLESELMALLPSP